jgi:DNA-binding transcriptional LysR family regulator
LAFEACCRLGSMSAAARELAVSQPAVSQRLQRLETHLGLALFDRSSRGLSLTAAGRDYREAVRVALDALEAAGAGLRSDADRRTIRILTNFGFAQFWLMPRLARLRAAFPQALLQLTTSDRDQDLADIDCDLAIRFGIGAWPGWTVEMLFAEEAFPVCAPAYLAEHGTLRPGEVSAAELVRENLLHMDEVSDRWLTWPTWLKACGETRPTSRPSLLYNSYSLLLQAALAGEGIALGWRGLVDPFLASGALVQLMPGLRRETRGYHLGFRPGQTTRKPLVKEIAAWLVAEHDVRNPHPRSGGGGPP